MPDELPHWGRVTERHLGAKETLSFILSEPHSSNTFHMCIPSCRVFLRQTKYFWDSLLHQMCGAEREGVLVGPAGWRWGIGLIGTQWMCERGVWQFWPLWLPPTCPLSPLAAVSSAPTPPCPLSPVQQKDLLELGGRWREALSWLLCHFSSLRTPFGFRPRSILWSRGATIYIVAWEWRPHGPFCCEVGWGSSGWGRGRGLPFVPASGVGFSSHRHGAQREGAEVPAAWQGWGNVYKSLLAFLGLGPTSLQKAPG